MRGGGLWTYIQHFSFQTIWKKGWEKASELQRTRFLLEEEDAADGLAASSNFSRQSCLQSMHKSGHFTNSSMLTSHRSHELENVSLKRSKPRNQPHNNQTEHKSALSYARAQKQQGACQGMVLSSGGSCQTPISTEGVASCMMQTGVWEVEDEKNLNQRSEWQKLKRWGQAQFSEESILPGELKQSQTSCNILLSKKKSVYSGAPANFLKTKQQVLPQAMQANILFVKGAWGLHSFTTQRHSEGGAEK